MKEKEEIAKERRNKECLIIEEECAQQNEERSGGYVHHKAQKKRAPEAYHEKSMSIVPVTRHNTRENHGEKEDPAGEESYGCGIYELGLR